MYTHLKLNKKHLNTVTNVEQHQNSTEKYLNITNVAMKKQRNLICLKFFILYQFGQEKNTPDKNKKFQMYYSWYSGAHVVDLLH